MQAQSRVGLTKFARNCDVNQYLELPEDMTKQRWCFPAKAMLVGKTARRKVIIEDLKTIVI